MRYEYNGAVQNISFDVKLNISNIDDTIIEVSFSKDSHGAIDILKKISEKYFIYLKPYTFAGNYILSVSGVIELVKNPQAIAELLKTYNRISAPQIDYHVLPRLKKLTIFNGGITDTECKLLTEWINKDKFIRDPVIRLYDLVDDDIVLKFINICKSNKGTLVSLKSNRQFSSNIQDKLKELNEYTYSRKNSIIELMTRLVKEKISSEEEFKQIEHKEFTQLLKDNTLEVFWNLKNDPKIHKMVSEKLKSTTKNTTNTLTEFSTSILNKYILPNTNGIENCEVLSPGLELAVHFKKLPLELQEHIVKFTTSKIFSSSFNTEDPQKTKILQSTPNKVKDLVSKPQEQTTKMSSAEAVTSDNALAYDIVDSINTTDQTSEDMLLVGSNQSYVA